MADTILRTHSRTVLIPLAGLLAAACGNSPIRPSKTQIIYPPALTCPAAISTTSPTDLPYPVSYTDPAETAGTPPVSVVCTPTSGTQFPIGQTTVTCTATDSVKRTASCSFNVTVLEPPKLRVSRVLAFGDSVTAGEINSDSNGRSLFSLRSLQLTQAYPEDLRQLLAARYTAQATSRADSICWGDPAATPGGIAVINAGCPGEDAENEVGRFDHKLAVYSPDLVLIEEGVNDINDFGSTGASNAVRAIQTMIEHARSRGARVLVATLPPERAGALRAEAPAFVAPYNAALAAMAHSEQAIVVDLYSDFVGHLTDWIGPDGLHPTAAGYQEIARMFFDAIKANIETPPTSTPTTAAKQRHAGTAVAPAPHR